MEATLSNLRISPRKVRVVATMLRGLSVAEASVQLRHELRRAALPLEKLLASAVANARENNQAIQGNLFVEAVIVDEGQKMKRWMPRAQGRATPIWKRMTHIRIVLGERVPGLRSEDVAEISEGAKSSRRRSVKRDETSFRKDVSSPKKPVGSGTRASRSAVFHRKAV